MGRAQCWNAGLRRRKQLHNALPPPLSCAPCPQVTNVKLVLADGPFTYEPSYNLVKKAPSLAVSRPLGPGKYKVRHSTRRCRQPLAFAGGTHLCIRCCVCRHKQPIARPTTSHPPAVVEPQDG